MVVVVVAAAAAAAAAAAVAVAAVISVVVSVGPVVVRLRTRNVLHKEKRHPTLSAKLDEVRALHRRLGEQDPIIRHDADLARN